jgi:hypothetical protein
MKKPRVKKKKLAQKRAKKAAKRKKIVKEKLKRHRATMDFIRGMSEEELEEFYDEDHDNCDCH